MTEPGGVWLLNEVTGALHYVETHRGSTVASSWPVRDRHSLYHIQRGCDWLLNAAGAGMDAFTNALRARWPHDPIGTNDPEPLQSDFWYRQLAIGSLGAQVTLFVGDLDTAGRSGFVVDDSKDGDTVTGWPGGEGGTHSDQREGWGQGPGRGLGGTSRGTGGGASTVGGRIKNSSSTFSNSTPGGLAVPAEFVLRGITSNNFARENWLAGGGGGGGVGNTSADGGASGGGYLAVSVGNMTESSSRTLSGAAGGSGADRRGGGGSGGTYLAIAARSYTQSGGTITGTGGMGGRPNPTTYPQGGDGADGHLIVIAGDTITFSGTRTNIVTTQWRLIAAPPPGGSLVTNP